MNIVRCIEVFVMKRFGRFHAPYLRMLAFVSFENGKFSLRLKFSFTRIYLRIETSTFGKSSPEQVIFNTCSRGQRGNPTFWKCICVDCKKETLKNRRSCDVMFDCFRSLSKSNISKFQFDLDYCQALYGARFCTSTPRVIEIK